ncbi:MAG: hypothetical protein QNK23_08100 [Crocinitomicaceae bacterium]|nr:hypothetical protein [Crocinitomicaceae bacterium]
MSIYKDGKDKLEFTLKGSGKVYMSVDALNQSRTCVTCNSNNAQVFNGDPKKEIGNSNSINGKLVRFTGAGEKRTNDNVKFVHTISQDGGDSIEYVFPQDYTGEVAFEESDEMPSYMFYIKFS